MTHERQHYTLTMARLLAQQGHWREAVEIYRHLVRENPGREDLAAALAEAEERLREPPRGAEERLVPLFEEWIRLIFKSRRMRSLQRLKQRL
ncbi:MAG: hypothetical protein R6V84_14410 [Desulfobacterales bacterium]